MKSFLILLKTRTQSQQVQSARVIVLTESRRANYFALLRLCNCKLHHDWLIHHQQILSFGEEDFRCKNKKVSR